MIDRRYSLVAVASRPPPVAGQSLATMVLERELGVAGIDYRIVDLSRPFYRGNRLVEIARRAGQSAMLSVRAEMARRQTPKPSMLYLQLGQSTQAMARDVPVLAWAAARGLPTVVHVHGGGFRRSFEAAPAALRGMLKPLLARVSAAIALSPMLESMFDDIVPDDRVVSVANAPEATLTARAQITPASAHSRGLQVLYLSNLIDSKGYQTVLESARLCAERGLPHRFVLAGAHTEMASVDPHDFIREHELDNVDYVGSAHGEDKLSLLESSQVFVLPTAYPTEGQPISILEAMQFGLPIVSTQQGGIADIVEDGVHGTLVAAGDAEAIVEALENMGQHGERYDALAGQARAHGLGFTSERHGAEMIAVFDEVWSRS